MVPFLCTLQINFLIKDEDFSVKNGEPVNKQKHQYKHLITNKFYCKITKTNKMEERQ